MSQFTPRAGGMTPRVPMGPPGMMFQIVPPEVPAPSRAFSAPRAFAHGHAAAPPPIAVATVGFSADAPPGVGGLGVQVSLQPFSSAFTSGTHVATPGVPPPVGLFEPPFGQPLQDNVEGKIRQWLRTIAIGNGAERGWDDSQIAEIAEFAEGKHLENLEAEDIYKRFVEYQVERAEEEAAA